LKNVLLLCVFFTGVMTGLARAAPALNSPLSPWNGEYMQADQGALYARFYLDKFQKSRGARDITTSVFMNLRNSKTGEMFVLSQPPTENSSEPVQVWKIPAGNYTVEKLSINENSGLTRNWVPNGKKPTILIRYLLVSNLGEIRLSPNRRDSLKVIFLAKPNAFVNVSNHQSFMGVVDGYKGTLQKRLGGSKLMDDAKDSFGTNDEARVAFTMNRQISMVHLVDSSGSQKSRKLISSTIQAQDADLRRCYMDQLDIADGLRGSVTFKFQISGNNGSFQTLSYNGGTLSNPKAVECLTLALKRMQFPIAKSLSGRLAFQFNYDDNPGRARFP